MDRERAQQVEACDERAWRDMYQAIPQAFAEKLGFEQVTVGDLSVFLCAKVPFIHFNACGATLGLGPADAARLDAVAAAWRERGIGKHWVHTIPEVEPRLSADLAERGYVRTSTWDRVHRRPAPLPALPPLPRPIEVRRVGSAEATAWAGFIDRVYGLPTSPWLLALVGRPGWHHYAAFEAGQIVAVRTLCVTEGWGWLGIDAPIPGVMTADMVPDRAILRAIVADLPSLGCTDLVSDVEANSPGRDTEGYVAYQELGFEVLYTRVNVAGA